MTPWVRNMLQWILQKFLLTDFTPWIISNFKTKHKEFTSFIFFIFRTMAVSKTANSSTSNKKYGNAVKKNSYLQGMPEFRLYNALIYCGYYYVVSETLTTNVYLSDLLVN